MSSSITITEEQAEQLVYGDIPEDFDCEIIKVGDWVGGKYQAKATVFKHNERTYMVGATRTGSHYTDFYMEYETKCYVVKPVEVTTVKWVIA